MAAASAVAAIILVAVLTVITAIGRDRARLALAPPSAIPVQAMIAELFRRDLAGADRFTMEQGTLVIVTHSAIDPRTLKLLDRPSIVTFRRVAQAGSSWLMRQQQFADEPVASPLSTRLVACDVDSVDVQPLPDAAAPAAVAAAATRPAEPRAMPRRVRLQVKFHGGIGDIDQIVCLR
jgi:hypothetical protein